MELKDKYEQYSSHLEWVEETYNKDYAPYFQPLRNLNSKLKSSLSASLTNEELEHVLITVPLDMIEVSEKLDNLKIMRDVTKTDIKEFKNEISKDKSDEENEQIRLEIYDNDVFVQVTSSLIDRVEKQMSFAKEFVMSCKKIWDSRITNSSPIAPIDTQEESETDPYSNLPEYRG